MTAKKTRDGNKIVKIILFAKGFAWQGENSAGVKKEKLRLK
jgi:hypothetical protein